MKAKRQKLPSKPRIKPGQDEKPLKTDDDSAMPKVELPPQVDFPIVGIGASAGGLAAFEAFFSGMPANQDPGMAFVLVQHLAPDHKSILSELIGRYTRMQVFEVADGVTVQPNCAYIIPPNRDMAFLNGTLQLLEPSAQRGLRLPIDFFFRSLAQDRGERAIGIILSGTGSDGTQGLRAIKGEGGLAIAQTPESTEYDGMPRSAIATGLVDYVLTPVEMPARLMTYAGHTFGKTDASASPPTSTKTEDLLKKIFIQLRVQTGHDFSLYKRNTITRRVDRRMSLHQIEQLEDYVRYLQQTPAEAEVLFHDLLIGVTQFFRDPEAFAVFQEQALPRLFSDKPAGAMLRIWSPGCSTGEEAYSIAMLLQERPEVMKQDFKVQVFATDIDRRAIDQARSGFYTAGVAADISAERLTRFFTQEPGGGFRIQKSLRDIMVFSEQDVIKDPPFSKLDLISCRNLLIYMGADLQKRLIPLFHYALNPGGLLFLGTSETVGEFTDLFGALDRKSKIYQRKEDGFNAQRPILGKFLPRLPADAAVPHRSGKTPRPSKLPLSELTERALLQLYAPAAVLVNERGEILYLHGRTGQYLEPAPGEAGLNILPMAREGLRQELTNALHNAISRKEPVHIPGLRVKSNGDFTFIHLTVRPITADFAGFGKPAANADQNLFMVVFEEAPAPEPLKKTAAADSANGASAPEINTDVNMDARIVQLTQELRAKEEYLQTTNEELETSNEELKSSNEEMQSVNEELQSTNEELETSKEELQSVNEELATVNTELEQKVTDLSRANNDMNNLLAGTDIGTIFVDHQLNIQRFTPTVTQVINLIQSDVGRPVGHIVSNLIHYDRLVDDVQTVLNTLVPKEIEVQTKTGAWFLLRIRPYRTLENVIEGAVITFLDTTQIKQAQNELRKVEPLLRLAVVVRDAHDAITTQDLEGRILAWNPGAVRMYGWTEAEALALNIRDRVPESLRQKELTIVHQLGRSAVLEPYRTQRLAKDGRIVEIWLTATALVNEAGEVYAIATTEREAVVNY